MKTTEHQRWVVAVDGGGSKIAVAAQLCADDAPVPDSLDAARLWTFPHCGSAHPSTWTVARHHLTEALHAVRSALSLDEAGRPVGHVLFALAGAGRAADRSKVLEWARTLEAPFNCSSISCVSDIEPLVDYRQVERPQGFDEAKVERGQQRAAGRTVEEPVPAVAVILGTGSMVATRDRNRQVVRAGGWGPHLGDECSGGALGVAALRSVTEWLDAGSKPDQASRLVMAVLFALPNHDDWMPGHGAHISAPAAVLASDIEIDRDKLAGLIIESAASRSAAAGLAHVVLELAFEHKDADALRLLEPHLERLSWQIEQVVRRAHPESAGFELVFSGGLAGHHPALRDALAAACRARQLRPRGSVVAEPLLAALQLAFIRSCDQ